ncbi:hypothetical protein ACED25_22145 [Vibrio sp. 1F263]|uniref:hypothetical protein n=1 Tax=Vibrio sp. 1F263 TaxID=3230012 RepID=UPI00352C3EE9
MKEKLNYLLNVSKMYESIIEQTSNDCLKRFLAFKIILCFMSFEDLIKSRNNKAYRDIRNIFLAHQQNGEFFDAFYASDQITKIKISSTISEMENHLGGDFVKVNEILDANLNNDILSLSKGVLGEYHKEFHEGYRLSNNFLFSGGDQIKEISSNPIASSFYRYNSSKELSIFANFFITNFINYNLSDLMLRSFKIDYILHAVNMWDTVFKDNNNRYSIDGLYEIVKKGNIGSIQALDSVRSDTDMLNTYKKLRLLRNKLSGHMDNKIALNTLFTKLDAFDINRAYEFVNVLDKAVWETANTHITMKFRYHSNLKLKDENIIGIAGIKNRSYHDNG